MITVRQSVPAHIMPELATYIDAAIAFLQPRYPGVDFTNLDFIFSSGYSRSRYYRNESGVKYKKPVAAICVRATLMLYDMKSLDLKRTRMRVGYEIQTVSALIHVLTHHAQHELTKHGGEIETTTNEIEHLRESYPYYYQKFVKQH